MLVLQRARGGIVDDGVAVDVVIGILLRDAAAAGADDDTEFAFVVGRVAVIEIAQNRLAGPDHRIGPFGERNRQLRNRVLARTRIDAAVVKFMRVVVIILAHAQHVLRRARDRCQQFYTAKRQTSFAALHRRACAFQAIFAERDKRRHVFRQAGRRRQINDAVGFNIVHADARTLVIRKSNQTH